MKQCPHCQAQLQDNARFCLYCMTPLVEKEQLPSLKPRHTERLLITLFCLLAGIALLVLAGKMLFGGNAGQEVLLQSGPSRDTGSQTGPMLPEQSTPDSSATEDGPEETQSSARSPVLNLWQTLFPGSSQTSGTTTGNTATPTSPPKGTTPVPAPGNTTPSTTTTPTSPATTTAPTIAPTTEATTEPDWRDYGNGIPGTEGFRTTLAINTRPEDYEERCLLPLGKNPDVLYGDATAENMNDPNYVNPGNECITGPPINYSQNGICYIPAYVGDNCKVVAIGKTLCEMVSIYLPETIVYIGKGAFRGNYKTEVAYVHIASDVVDIHPEAFPVRNTYTVVMRTSAQCRNSKGEYYKDIAGRYGCVWEEWNG